MTEKNTIKRRLVALAAITVTASPLALLGSVSLPGPAAAQFFPFFAPYQQMPQDRYREAPADYSKAPSPKKPETPPASTVVVMGDSMADWLAYGLEDAFSDTPEIGIVRKNKPYSGLIRYESRGDLEWSSVARDIITTEKPAAVVMLLGLSDRVPIRERPGTKPAPAQSAQPQDQPTPEAENPELQIIAPETPRGRNAGGSNEFRSEQWAALYTKRIADTIAAMKSKGVPVIWVGMPIVRGPKATSDTAYLNDLYRAQAEKAGIIYVDVWDGFVDETGKFASFGPDVDGQTRRLRSNDGVYFTKFGARKLAHYVEREIRRVVAMRGLPMALPSDNAVQPAGLPRPGGPVARPVAGAIVPLTAGTVSGSEELLGGGSARPGASDPIATRVLVKGEPVSPLKGRADDFVWPQGGGAALPAANLTAEPGTITPVEIVQPAAPAGDSEKRASAGQTERGQAATAQDGQRKPRPASQASRDASRPPAPVDQRYRSPFSFFR
jgi:hypothetical protein